MAGDPLIRDAGEYPQQRLFLPAAIDHEGTSSREPAARWRIDQGRDFARNAVPHRTPSGIGNRECSEERLRVRVERSLEDVADRARLCDLAEIHHCNPVGYEPDRGDVVRDHEVREPELTL